MNEKAIKLGAVKSLRTPKRQKGLTLIELVVVLTILIATGSLLVPVIGNALSRSHVSTCASNFPEVTKLLVSANATLGTFGSGWTTGVDGAGAAVNNDAGAASPLSGAVDTLTADEAEALADLGIAEVCDHGSTAITDYNITFNADLTCAAVAAGDEVITLDAAAAAAVNLAAPAANQKYIWLGMDKTWSLLGTLTPEPPVHFGDEEGILPHQVYSRFGAIFLIEEADAGAAANSDASASFQRVSYNLEGASDTFQTADNHIGIHWNEVHGTGI